VSETADATRKADLEETGRALFRPRSVAILGASLVPEKPGARLVRALVGHGPGPDRVYAINPKLGDFGDVRCYPSVGDVGAEIDLAVIALPAGAVAGAVRECDRAGARTAIVITAGFAEEGPAGAERQRELRDIADASGLRLLGPNCVGVINFRQDIAPFFGSVLNGWQGPLSGGSIALVSQSGALATLLIERAREQGLGLSHIATTGNEVDLQWCDLVEYLSGLDEVTTIAGYLETVRNGPAFERALALARDRGKRVVVLRAGSTGVGQRSAAAHTAGVTTDAAALTAVLAKYGVIEVGTVEELLASVTLLSRHRRLAGRRVAILAASGGLGAVLADRATELGLDVPVLSAEVQRGLLDVLPPLSSAANPVDGTGPLGRLPDSLSAACRVLDRSGEVDVVACFMGAGHAAARPAIVEVLTETGRDMRTPLLCGWLASSPEYVRQLNLGGVPAFGSPLDLLRAVAQLSDAAGYPGVGAEPDRGDEAGPLAEGPTLVAPGELFGQLAQAGVGTVPRVQVPGGPGAAAALFRAVREIKHDEFMLKAHRPGTAHKSEYGGVAGPFGRADSGAIERFTAAHAEADAFEIQGFVRADWELYVSLREDETFGYTCVLGLGGILVDILRTSVCLALPVAGSDIARAVRSSPLRAVFAGARGRTAVDPAALALLIGGLVAVMEKTGYPVLELNPVLCERQSGNLIAVDAYAEQGSAQAKGGIK
jgi:acetate---CoA ligase (ADP-forming)